MFDYARIQEEFASVATLPPGEIIAHLADSGDAWMTGSNQEDDITFLVLRRKGEA
jgi:serine phosphatase RsbU (regulator of sigma subunit)